jgi:hypothetical protein
VGPQAATLHAHLPAAYPSQAPPLVVLEGHGITPAVTDWAVAQLDALFVPGEAVLYTWVEAVRDHLDAALDSDAVEEAMAIAAAAETQAAERKAEVRTGYRRRGGEDTSTMHASMLHAVGS